MSAVMVCFVAADGARIAVEAAPGTTLMEAAKAADIAGIEAVCGGNCYCGTCRVHLPEAWLAVAGPAGEFERPLIDSSEDAHPGARLSCQITLGPGLDGIIAHIPCSRQ